MKSSEQNTAAFKKYFSKRTSGSWSTWSVSHSFRGYFGFFWSNLDLSIVSLAPSPHTEVLSTDFIDTLTLGSLELLAEGQLKFLQWGCRISHMSIAGFPVPFSDLLLCGQKDNQVLDFTKKKKKPVQLLRSQSTKTHVYHAVHHVPWHMQHRKDAAA